MHTNLEVLFAPAEFEKLQHRDLSRTFCVVFDVLRATSTMATALGNGAAAILPVAEIDEALAARDRHPGALLAGERNGLRIQLDLTGSVPFDLGNSPREFTREIVAGKTVIITTTNGTRALRACARAQAALIGSFLNLGATADFVRQRQPADVLLVCSGTLEQAAYEDVLAAGALCQLIWPGYSNGVVADSAQMARWLFNQAQNDLLAAIQQSRNGRRLMANLDLRDDVVYCAQKDALRLVAGLGRDQLVKAINDL
jgi:2-phosphosulfolactate phosphatase